MDSKEAWERCAAFHGHVCGGLAIGYQAARLAAELLGIGFCIGKGNLLFHMRGKQAFSFYDRKSGKSLRLVLKDRPESITREQSMDYYLSQTPKDLFLVKDARPIPEKARIFRSYRCACCGEMTGENWIRLVDGEYRCLDCSRTYDRFHV